MHFTVYLVRPVGLTVEKEVLKMLIMQDKAYHGQCYQKD